MDNPIKNPSLRWYKEDVIANLPEGIDVNMTQEYAQELLQEFFDIHMDWITQSINEAMSDFLEDKLTNQES